MNGLELSRIYFEQVGLPSLQAEFGHLIDRMTFGLVGEGSQCFGFDDETSRDHDWGSGFCIWLDSADYEAFGAELQGAYDCLPQTFSGFSVCVPMPYTEKRLGVFEAKPFYQRLLRVDRLPAQDIEWRFLHESLLAVAANGAVFREGYGEFMQIRRMLLSGYPADIRLKKLAARCMRMGQAGQYNYPRCISRGESVAAQFALCEFAQTAISTVYLLNQSYMPFYKWAHRGLLSLPLFGTQLHRLLRKLFFPDAGQEEMIETICELIIFALHQQKLSDTDSPLLAAHGPAVQSRIQDVRIRLLPVVGE